MRKYLLWAVSLAALSGCVVQDQPSQSAQPAGVDQAALRAAATDPRAVRFYEARGWQGVWTAATARDLIAALGDVQRHALSREQFLAPIQAARTEAERDAALSLAALSYGEALARGRTDPSRIRDIYTVPRPEADLTAGLTQALQRGNVREWLAGLAPQDADYRALSEAYLTYNRQASAALAQPATRTAETQIAAERARTLAINLERLRWLPREAPGTRIDVNTGAATLAYYRDGAVVDRRRVVVGEPGHETPQLGSPIFRLVANPTWTVPRSIEQNEIAGRGAGYLARNNMERRDGWIVQRSGPTNSLGLVKFDMQNEHAIYLHDTPAKALFQQDERHRSHGCVRVFDALGFAHMIAEQEGVLPEWERARATGEQTYVPLPRQIPVRLLYHTAFVDNGQVTFVPDAYGWDEDVAEALGLARRPRSAARPSSADVGP